jgi:hypothetical protein
VENGDTPHARAQNRLMLLLDPAQPPLWRSPDVLQFGVDRVAELHDPTIWQQRMLAELERGVPEAAVEPLAIALGGTRADAQALLAQLRPVLLPPSPHVPTVQVRVATGTPPGAGERIVDALAAAGLRTDPAADGADVVVVVSVHVTSPLDAAALMRDDITHLPVVFTGRGATVGPLVQPGRTACLMCVEAERTDGDPAWPTLAAQLLHRAGHPVPDSLALEAGLAAGHLISGRDRTAWASRSLQLTAGSARRTWRVHRPHAACGCRSPQGNATATGRRGDPATMTPTASARRA